MGVQHAVDGGQIHELLADLPRFDATFSALELPKNGIYFFYEEGEGFEGAERIVRVGTRRGESRLAKRLTLHYNGRARRSVFRQHIGNALVQAGLVEGIPGDGALLGSEQFTPELEAVISVRFAQAFTFSVIRLDDREDRLRLEAGLIGSLSAKPGTRPSATWLGFHSPVEAVRSSGLWNKNHVGGPLLSVADFSLLRLSI